MGFVVLAIGLVLCVEGLVFALAPSRIDDLLKAIADIPHGTRRTLGGAALALGVVIVAFARSRMGV